MELGLTLTNYRCFSEHNPARFRIENGFTALVGSNNSGKSSLLKFFFEFRKHLASLTEPNVFLSALGGRQGLALADTIRDFNEVFWNRTARTLTIEFELFGQESTDSQPNPNRLMVEVDRIERTWTARIARRNSDFLPSGGFDWQGPNLLRQKHEHVGDVAPFFDFFRRLTRCIYVPAYRNAINAGSSAPYYDVQTGQAFVSQWRSWQAGEIIEHRRDARRLTDAIREIFGYERLEVNATDNGETLELFIDGESYLLPEVGSGIAQFFMVLANAATRKPPFVLIDEPELNLHPSLQRNFLRSLATFASDGVIFATHNLGLALSQADRIYSVQRIAQGQSIVQPYAETPRLPEFLGELSFAGYKQLGFDKVLLVEGVTDLRAVQFFLSFYGKQDKVVLLPLGGNTMINGNRKEELQEVQRICPNVYALIDSEKSSASEPLESSRQGFLASCASLSPPIQCKVLDRRSTENYFSDAAVKAILGSSASALAPYQRAPTNWKVDNWKIAQEMTRGDIEMTDLGRFLGSL